MNKKIAIILGLGGALIVLVLAVLLIARGCDRVPGVSTLTANQNTTGNTESADMDTTGVQPSEITDTAGQEGTPSTEETLEMSGGVATRPNNDTQTTPDTGANQGQTEPTAPSQDGDHSVSVEDMTYEMFMQLSGQEKAEFAKNFTDEEFVDWYNRVKQEYEESRPEIEITGPIDLEDFD